MHWALRLRQAAIVRAILANYDKDQKPKTVAELLKRIEGFRAGFQDVWRLLQIAITVPVTSAQWYFREQNWIKTRFLGGIVNNNELITKIISLTKIE